MREDLEHNFDLAEFNASCRVMKCAKELFPHSLRDAERWAIACYHSWTSGGLEPEKQRDRRNPRWRESLIDDLELFDKDYLIKSIICFLPQSQLEELKDSIDREIF